MPFDAVEGSHCGEAQSTFERAKTSIVAKEVAKKVAKVDALFSRSSE
jgi:hypothetical protein